MSGYLGQTPGIGQTQYFAYTCTAGQTTFSGPDNSGYVLNYNVGFADVFLNGRRLTPTLDYTATDGSTITLLSAASASDIVFISALSAFSTAQWVTNAVNYVYVATAGQTVFSGVDSNSATLSYVAGTIVVSVNGVIIPQSDYAALDGLTVTLASGVNVGDIVQIFSLRTMNPVSISNWITNNLTNIVDYTYIATAGQTTFSGAAYAGGTLAYKAGCIQVTVNGLVLTPADYTATNGTSVVLNVGCNLDDTVVIRVFGNTTVAGVYTQAQSDAKYVQLGVSNTVTPSMLTQPLTAMTAVASTSGTSIDFTSIPSWVKRITVMFNSISTNGTSPCIIQLGSGSIDASSYVSSGTFYNGSTGNSQTATTGLLAMHNHSSSENYSGIATICLVGSNVWVHSAGLCRHGSGGQIQNSGTKTLSGALDRIRITMVNGTDAFDAGSINVMYE